MRKLTAALLVVIATLAGTAAAEAAPLPISTLVGSFNAIVENNFFTTSDTEGNVLIGGNLGGSGGPFDSCFGSACAITPPPNFGNVNVFGNNTWSGVQPHGVVFVAGSNSGSFLGNPCPAGTCSGHVFANNFVNDIWTPLTGFQANLASLANNSSFNPTTGVFLATPGTNGVAVWNLTTTQLNAATTNLCFSTTAVSSCAFATGLPSTDAGVVNVTCPTTPCNFIANQTWFPLSPVENAIFDFGNEMNVEMGGNRWETSIIATNSEVFNTSPIEGTLIAESYGGNGSLGSGELHNDLFDCAANVCTTPMPEPGSLAVLGSALAGFAAIRRRRRG